MLCAALAIHVCDEAANDFLAIYNPNAIAIRERLPWLPVPVFTFQSWILLLAAAIVVLLLLAPPAYRGVRRLRPFAYIFAVAMMANGAWHTLASIYLHRFAPGVYSSPLLLAAGLNLIVRLRRTRENKQQFGEKRRE